jgi:glycosyltransferase involved in cell wall biosynthesis
MRIALLSTCALSVPPPAYGGTERVIAELAKQLTRRGHDVTVFASGDSRPEARLRSHFPKPIWPPDEMAELRHAAFAWRDILRTDGPFDVVHAHTAPSVAFSTVCLSPPTLMTLHHERVDNLVECYRDFSSVTYVAISQRQADLLPELGIQHVVHHGLDPEFYDAGDGAGGWLAFVGRLAPEKGPHLAIDAALAARVPLHIGGKPHAPNEVFFEREVRPRLARAGDRVKWQGEVSFAPKLDLLRGARATLFPIQWEEPFGLVMIESMLVGTPVIAFRRGSAPEVVDDGVTGFLVRDVDDMAARVAEVGAIDRRRCRERARERWSSARMARDYEAIYASLVRASSDASRERLCAPVSDRAVGHVSGRGDSNGGARRTGDG